MSTYRDPLAVVLEELSARQASLVGRIGTLSGVQRAVLPPDDRATIERAAAIAKKRALTLDEAEVLRSELDDAERAIDRAIGLASSLLVFGDERPIVDAKGKDDGLARWLAFVVAPWGGTAARTDAGGIAHFEIDGTQIELRVDAEQGSQGELSRLRFESVTQVPITLGPVVVRPERALDGVARALHISREHEFADARFDDAYWVTGEREAVRTLLTGTVRSLLCDLLRHTPSLRVEAGAARLAWTPTADFREIFETLTEGWWGGTSRERTERLVPTAAFEVQHALRELLDPR